MILKSTKIAGDLKIAKGKHIYVSGSVQAPPLAILEDSDIPLNESVVFSVEDTTPGTIKTSGTTITDSSITVPNKSTSVVVEAATFAVSANEITTTGTTIETQPSTATAVTTCKKLVSAAPEWSSADRVYIKEPVCYIYSSTQPRSDYIEASRSIDLVYSNEFITPTASALKKVTEYRLITDHTFSPN